MKRHRQWGILISLLAAILLVVASCGGGSTTDGSSDASDSPAKKPVATDVEESGDDLSASDDEASTDESSAADAQSATGDVEQLELVLDDFSFTPSTLTLPADTTVELTIRNTGSVDHELMAGRDRSMDHDAAGYHQDLIAMLDPEVVRGDGYHMQMMGAGHAEEVSQPHGSDGHGTMISSEIVVEPGGEAVLQFQTPPDAQGTWEMGCLLEGHYESGMKGTINIGDAAASPEIAPETPSAGLIAAIDYIDSAGFHGMSEDLAAGEINPRFLSTVEKVIAVTTATAWPADLQAAADTFQDDLQVLADALADEDVEAAATAAADIHASQHDLSHQVFETLGSVSTGESSSAGLIVAIDYIDSAGFHGMSEELAAGEINPRFLGTVEKVVVVVEATAWPADLQAAADAFQDDAQTLADGLADEDVEAAATAAADIHASQHDLSHKVFETLDSVSTGEPSSTGLIAAIDYIDSAGFHGMSEELAAGEINPRFLGTVEKVIAVTEGTTWPHDFEESVGAFQSDLQVLADALADEDVEAASSAAADIHASQHDLSHDIFAQLSGGHGDDHAASEETQEVSLEITDWDFSGDVRVEQGTVTLTVTNNGRMPHGLYLPEFKINESIAAGETVTITFEADEPGTYTFMCNEPMCGTAEQHTGMRGSLIVE